MINVAVIGANFGAKVHVPAFKLIPNVNVVSLCSRSNNILDIMQNDTIHAVSIALPPVDSYEIIKSAIKYKKHIFCEKPLSYDLNTALDIKNSLSAGIINAIDFEICESEVVKHLKYLIDTKIFGNINGFDCNWKLISHIINHPWKFDVNKGGGAVNNFGSHIFYLLEWIFADRIINLSGKLLPKIEFNTCVDAKIDFESFSGNLFIDCNTNMPSNFIFKVYCEKGDFILRNNSKILKNFSLSIKIDNTEQLIKFENDTSNKDGRIDLVSSLAGKFIDGIKLNMPITPNIENGVRTQLFTHILLGKGKL